MASPALVTKFVCQQCGTETPKWAGRCPSCQAWNSLVETAVPKRRPTSGKSAGSSLNLSSQLVTLSAVATDELPRLSSGFDEADRVLGGGIVPGSVVLIGGEPGIGKSTLLLQIILNTGGLYISAEESAHQIKRRAERLASKLDQVQLLATNNIDVAIATIQQADPAPRLVVVDSIQTVMTEDLDGVPGSVGQVREAAHRLVNIAKSTHIPIIVVSHVTKEGTIAGPKVLEHVVDAVIYIEGEEFSMTRILRGIKNRFGPVHEVGLFELKEQGMAEVVDPGGVFVSETAVASGSAITVTMEGIRPMILEIQALATPTSFGLPRRTANGIDLNRQLMLIAVMTKRMKLGLANQDIYTNIAGGLKIKETAMDLPVCLAIASSVLDKPLPPKTVAFGEVSLSGEVKPVIGQQQRIDQAKKMGYTNIISSPAVTSLQQAMNIAFPHQRRSS